MDYNPQLNSWTTVNTMHESCVKPIGLPSHDHQSMLGWRKPSQSLARGWRESQCTCIFKLDSVWCSHMIPPCFELLDQWCTDCAHSQRSAPNTAEVQMARTFSTRCKIAWTFSMRCKTWVVPRSPGRCCFSVISGLSRGQVIMLLIRSGNPNLLLHLLSSTGLQMQERVPSGSFPA